MLCWVHLYDQRGDVTGSEDVAGHLNPGKNRGTVALLTFALQTQINVIILKNNGLYLQSGHLWNDLPEVSTSQLQWHHESGIRWQTGTPFSAYSSENRIKRSMILLEDWKLVAPRCNMVEVVIKWLRHSKGCLCSIWKYDFVSCSQNDVLIN